MKSVGDAGADDNQRISENFDLADHNSGENESVNLRDLCLEETENIGQSLETESESQENFDLRHNEIICIEQIDASGSTFETHVIM